MKVILVTVMSLDGKTTKNDNPDIYHWSSPEDQKHFFGLREKSKLLIMGRRTYDHAKHLIEHKKGRLRIVLTSNPEKYQTLPDLLEFTSDSPKKLLDKLTKRGFKEAVLLGGATTSTAFAKEKCIDEVWLTVEPYLFGKGHAIFENEFVDLSLKILSLKKLNQQGTLLLKYKVIK